ncbi:MAG: proton-conducting transporter membrane subunit [Ignavibacteria bacterium]|nr:proton-conducting transporter membrane subunit [Ignavibacteria bacterium]
MIIPFNTNIDFIIVLPVIIPLIAVLFLILFRNSLIISRIINITSSILIFFVSIILFINIDSEKIIYFSFGNWIAPFGIIFAMDMFSAIMVLMTGFMALCISIYFLSTIDSEREKYGFYIFFQIMIAGVCGVFLTGDIFNLFVWFELMLISSFVLIVLGNEKCQLEGAVKYVTLNLLASFIFLFGIGFLYSITGTLNFADLSQKIYYFINQTERSAIPGLDNRALINAISMLFFVSFGIKAAIFPLFFWLPASYHTPPIAVTAIFSALLTKAGVYSMMRVFTVVFHFDLNFTSTVMIILAGFTMVTGVLGAFAQSDIRRILSFHIISQIGYILMGLGIYTEYSLAAAVFFMLHIILTKTVLFMIAGWIYIKFKTYCIDNISDIFKTMPFVSILFLISAGSLAGIPPLPGFWAKFIIIKAGFESQNYVISIIAIFVSLLTLFSMLKIWNNCFWKETDAHPELQKKGQFYNIKPSMVFSILVIVIVMLIVSIYPEFMYYYSLKAGSYLMNFETYIQIILRN